MSIHGISIEAGLQGFNASNRKGKLQWIPCAGGGHQTLVLVMSAPLGGKKQDAHVIQRKLSVHEIAGRLTRLQAYGAQEPIGLRQGDHTIISR